MERRPNKNQLQPTGDWLIIEPIDVPDVSSGGVVIPGSSSRVDRYGKIVAAGPGYYQNGIRVSPGVGVGQTVMYRDKRGFEMRFNGETVLFMTERDLLAVIE